MTKKYNVLKNKEKAIKNRFFFLYPKNHALSAWVSII